MPTCNKSQTIGQRSPLKPSEVGSIRTRLQVTTSESGAYEALVTGNLEAPRLGGRAVA
jgi:hypothetical protein